MNERGEAMKKLTKKSGIDVVFACLIIAMCIFFCIMLPWISTVGGDGGDGHYALWAANAKILHDGEFPLWNPYNWGGYADVGHIHSVFYPILIVLEYIFWNQDTQQLSYMIFPMYIAIHLCIGALGMYVICRVNKRKPVIGLIISTMVVFSGCFTRGIVWAYILGGYAWITWLVLFLILMVEQKRNIWIVLSGIVLGLIGLSASAQGILFAVLVYFVLYCVVIVSDDLIQNIKMLLITTLRFLVSGFIGMGLASPVLFPFLETNMYSFRYIPGWNVSSRGRIPLAALKEDAVDVEGLMGLFGNYSGTMAIPILISLLAVFAFFIINKQKKIEMNFAKTLLCVSIFSACGWGIIDIFYYIPGFNAIREPILYAPLAIISCGILAQYSLDYFVQRINKGVASEYIFTNKKLCACVLGMFFIVAYLPHMYQGWTDIVIKILVILGSIFLALKIKINKSIINIILIIMVLLNYYGWTQYNSSNLYQKANEVEAKVSNVNDRARTLMQELDKKTIDGHDMSARYLRWSETEVLPANIAAMAGERDCFAYLNPIYKKTFYIYSYLDVLKKIQLQNIKYVLIGEDSSEEFVKYWESIYGQGIKTSDAKVYASYDSDELKKVKYVDTGDINIGSAWMVNDIVYYSEHGSIKSDQDAQEFIQKLNDSEFNPEKTVYVNTDKIKKERTIRQEGTIEYDVECKNIKSNSMKYMVNSEAEGVLVTSEFYYPGWHVKVDGKKSELLEVNYAFRGVYLSKGIHEVEFYYMPNSLILGCIVFILACVVAGICIIYGKGEKND